jgi:NTE family protein
MKSRIGLALGGGGARGIAHLGVWQRLMELGVELHCIAGTSIGAIAGAIIAAGRVDEALKWCAESDWKKLPKLFMETQFTSKALTKGTRVERLLAELVGAKAFDELSTRFAAVATDLNTGERVVMRDGDLLSAVRASMSIPGVFRPVERGGRILIDGQLVDPIPIAACLAMGADKVIAVDVSPLVAPASAKPFRKLRIAGVLLKSFGILNYELARRELAVNKPDVLIRPDVGQVLALDFRRTAQLVEIGRQAVDEKVVETLKTKKGI